MERIRIFVDHLGRHKIQFYEWDSIIAAYKADHSSEVQEALSVLQNEIWLDIQAESGGRLD